MKLNLYNQTLTQLKKPNKKSGVARPDPHGTKAIIYTIEMFKNGKAYNLEVL